MQVGRLCLYSSRSIAACELIEQVRIVSQLIEGIQAGSNSLFAKTLHAFNLILFNLSWLARLSFDVHVTFSFVEFSEINLCGFNHDRRCIAELGNGRLVFRWASTTDEGNNRRGKYYRQTNTATGATGDSAFVGLGTDVCDLFIRSIR